MIWLIAALFSALIFGFSGFLMKVGCEKGHDAHVLLFGLYISGTSLFALSLLLQSYWDLSLLVIASSIIVGIGSAIGNNYTVRALAIGPASLTSPLINLNIVLVVLMSVFVFNESLKNTEILAIVLFITSCCLLSLDSNNSSSLSNSSSLPGLKDNKWLWFIMLAIVFIFLRNGGLKITQEIGLNNTLVLFYAYLFSLVLFATKFLSKSVYKSVYKSVSGSSSYSQHKQGLIIGCIAGLFSYGGLELYAFALQTGPASVVAPIFSLRSIVMVIMASLIYKEKLTFYQKLALMILFTGLITISY